MNTDTQTYTYTKRWKKSRRDFSKILSLWPEFFNQTILAVKNQLPDL